MNVIENLAKHGLITPPKHLKNSIQYLTIMGSEAYGVTSGDSDVDIYGFCIPSKRIVFPHTSGVIHGFDKNYEKFDQYSQHHIIDKDAKKKYDITVYNIVKYLALVSDGNPNMVDSLYTPQRCVLHMTQIGERVRSNRQLFLHKGTFIKLKSYAYSQVHKIKTKKPIGKRKDLIEKHGWDTKFGYHTVRLILQCKQILMEHDLDLERNREQLKAIRRGDWTKEKLINFFETNEKELESLYTTSTLPYGPDREKIKELLLECLEMYYGNLDKTISLPNDVYKLVQEIDDVVDKYRSKIK